MAQSAAPRVAVSRATRQEEEAVCALDALVLGHRERCPALVRAIDAGACWVARLPEGVVGLAVLSPTFFAQWFIELVIVHPAYRRRAVATALIRQCEAACPAAKLFTSTNQSNVPMQRVLAALGYERSGYVDHLDEGDPELIYMRRLHQSGERA